MKKETLKAYKKASRMKIPPNKIIPNKKRDKEEDAENKDMNEEMFEDEWYSYNERKNDE